MANLAGQLVGRYHIIEPLGSGGMATVYKAYDMRLEREVAIKFIRREAIASDQWELLLKRFEREARALAKLSHTGIIKVFDFGEYEGTPYLVMEFVPGGTLKALTGKPIPWQQALRLLLPVARALEYAHEKNIIHRDVKPGNILLTEKGESMLSDFGIAKILGVEETTSLTGTGVGLGTPEYMAPEQWQGKVVPQTDIYALGVVLFELLTGQKPYTADTPAAILIKQITEPLPRPRSFVPDLPEEVERILFKALAKKPAERYPTMVEFIAALERALTHPPVPLSLPKEKEVGRLPVDEGTLSASTPPAQPAQRQVQPSLTTDHLAPPVIQMPPPRTESRRSTGMNAALLWASIGIVALCLVGMVGAGIITQGFGLFKTQTTGTQAAFQGTTTTSPASGKTPQPAVTDTAAPGNTPRSTLTPMLTATVTLAPTPTPSPTATLAPVLAGTPLSLPLTAISPQNAGQVVALARWDITNGVTSAAFSPDGKTLAGGSIDYTVKLWRVSDGGLLSILKGHTGSVNSVAFSPDGKTLASGSQDNTVNLWRVADGSLLSTLKGHTDSIWSVTFSPDGKTLASGSQDNTVNLWRVSDGSLLSTLHGHMRVVTSVAFSPDGTTLASGSNDGTVKLWRVSGSSLLSTLEGNSGFVYSVSFSPDGKLLASGYNDGTVKLWRISDGSLLFSLKGLTDTVSSVTFSPDGATLASGSRDNIVKLWRVSDGSLLFTLKGHWGSVFSVTFSPDGTLLASGAGDGTIRLWGVPGAGSTATSVPETTRLPAGSVQITGAGATFPLPVYTEWVYAYQYVDPSVVLNYQGTGSGAGKKAIIDGTVDFAGSDSLVTDAEYTSGKDLQMYPMLAGAVVVIYNVKLNTGDMKAEDVAKLPGLILGRQTLVDICNAKITKWNDPAIGDLNPALKAYLPDASITAVHRSDSSGTTEIFTKALSAFSTDWTAGGAPAVEWSVDKAGTGVGGKGNAGVAAAVINTPNSLGYVELSYAISNKIAFVQMVNKAGKTVTANSDSVKSAMDDFSATFTDKLTNTIVDGGGDGSWPITGYTYLILHTTSMQDCVKAQKILEFIKWALTDAGASKTAASLGYSVLPDAIRTMVLTKLGEVTCSGAKVLK